MPRIGGGNGERDPRDIVGRGKEFRSVSEDSLYLARQRPGKIGLLLRYERRWPGLGRARDVRLGHVNPNKDSKKKMKRKSCYNGLLELIR